MMKSAQDVAVQTCRCGAMVVESCVFPFVYKNETYNACTGVDSDNGAKWCATEVDSDGVMVPVGVLFFLLFIFILLRRVNGDGAKPPATRINCWTVLNIVEITANASTMMTTPED